MIVYTLSFFLTHIQPYTIPTSIRNKTSKSLVIQLNVLKNGKICAILNRREHLTMTVVDKIINTLKQHGIIIQRYDSITSNSIYLKLDYGVLKSIRISDHPSKKHLHYRYNLQRDLITSRYDKRTKRFFYPTADVDRMLQQILSDRNDKKQRFGANYDRYMMENIRDNGHKQGFWSESQIIS